MPLARKLLDERWDAQMTRGGVRKSTSRFLMRSLLTVLLLAVAYFIGRVGLADFLRLEPTTYIDHVKEGKVRLSMEKLAQARTRLILVGHIDSTNPIVPEYLAQIAYIRAGYSGFDKELQRGYLREALDEYDSAIRLRPNSGYLWAGSMTVMYQLRSLETAADAQELTVVPADSDTQWRQMMVAMKHAIQLAPWERGVLAQVIVVGTKYYSVLSDKERQLFDSAKRNAVSLKVVVG